MKTPDEIKKALKLCQKGSCKFCPYDEDGYCGHSKNEDALSYIQQLESRLEQVDRERDAAVAEIKRMKAKTEEMRDMVNDVIHRELPYSDYLDFINQVEQICNYQFEREWRGVCEKNAKEDTNEQTST